jgi:tungsten cofactor oxidoreducase radical SAM maturase
MPKVIIGEGGELLLPADFLSRRRLKRPLECWLDERNGDLILHPRLTDIRKLYLEPTTVCNLTCSTCIRNSWRDPIAHMSPETFQRLLASMAGLPCLERVIVTSFGEPLTHPHILEMIAALRERDLAVTIGTNGLLLRPKMVHELIRLGVDRLVVSIDGGKPDTYASVRGALLSEVIGGIQRVNEAKHRLHTLKPDIAVEFVALRSNIDELEDLAKLAASLNISRLLVSNVLPYTDEMLAEKLYSYEPVPPLKSTGWALRADAWVIWAIEDLPRMHWGAARRCKFVSDHAVVVSWDGGVSPCYALSHNYSYFTIDGVKKEVDRYILGNVNSDQLVDIWTSEEYTFFRSQVKAFNFPSCPDCDLRDTCELRTQNLGCWGCNPSCADCLWAQDIIRCP